jgi:hypothetical protein
MSYKWKRRSEDDLALVVISSKEEAAVTILALLKEYNFSIRVLMELLTGVLDCTAFL